MSLHLRHEALRLHFTSAIWMVREVEGVLLNRGPGGWQVELSDPLDPDGGFQEHHPLAGEVFDQLGGQKFQTRQEALRAVELVLLTLS